MTGQIADLIEASRGHLGFMPGGGGFDVIALETGGTRLCWRVPR